MPDLTEDEIANTDFGTYTEDQFFDDMAASPQYRTDPDLCEILVRRSFETMKWLREQGRALRRSTAARRSRSTASTSSGAG